MSRLFLPNRLCAKRALLTARAPPLLTSRGGARVKQQQFDKPIVFIQQQTRWVGGSNAEFFKYRSKSRIWICGVAAGIAIALGLKYREDTASGSCEDQVEDAQADRYSDAIRVSRDLVERIKVSVQVRARLKGPFLSPCALRLTSVSPGIPSVCVLLYCHADRGRGPRAGGGGLCGWS